MGVSFPGSMNEWSNLVVIWFEFTNFNWTEKNPYKTDDAGINYWFISVVYDLN